MPPIKSDKSNDSLSDKFLQKYMDKMVKLQQDQEKNLQQELELLRTSLAQTNSLLDQLVKINESGSTIAAGKKIVPFHTGSELVGQQVIPPTDPDQYPTKIDVYSINSNKVIPHMTLINDGPGEIFFINAYAKNVFNEKEGHLNVNDQRELFNVFEIRLRATLPLTTIRLIEGIFRTGGIAPNTIANTTIRPTLQTNQILKDFTIQFDLDVPITITVPTVQNFAVDPTPLGLVNQPPLPPGETATPVDSSTGLPLPFTVPAGFNIELFGVFINMSTDYTVRSYFRFPFSPPGTFTRFPTWPSSNRGITPNESLNLSFFSTSLIFPAGAPPGGIDTMITITNDDPLNNMIGDLDILAILSRLS